MGLRQRIDKRRRGFKKPLQPLRKSRHLAIDETFAFTYDGANLTLLSFI